MSNLTEATTERPRQADTPGVIRDVVDLSPRAKSLLEAEQAKEAAEKIDRRWKITQVMFGAAILLQAAGTLLNNF